MLAKRERVIMLESWDKGMMATTLRYPYEIRDARDYFDDIPDVQLEPDTLKLAEQILRSNATDFDPARFVDRSPRSQRFYERNKQFCSSISRYRSQREGRALQ